MVYLLQDRTLRRKRDSRILRSLPALDALSRVTSNIMLAGLPMLTLSLILGALSIREPLAEWVFTPLRDFQLRDVAGFSRSRGLAE